MFNYYNVNLDKLEKYLDKKFDNDDSILAYDYDILDKYLYMKNISLYEKYTVAINEYLEKEYNYKRIIF